LQESLPAPSVQNTDNMNIVLVDDMPGELMRLSKILNEYAASRGIAMELSAFQSGEELLADYHPLKYTIIFLDIYMDGMTGVDAAKKIRQVDNDTLIVFLTTSMDHTFEAFGVHAYQYLLKTTEDEELKARVYSVLDDALDMNSGKDDIITFSSEGETKRLPLSSVLFVQSQRNYVLVNDIHGGSYLIRMTFSSISETLKKDSRFLQINRGIIVNMDHITDFGKNTCTLKGDVKLPVNVREQKKLDQIRQNYVFGKLRRKHIK